jgi:hypothetical protein
MPVDPVWLYLDTKVNLEDVPLAAPTALASLYNWILTLIVGDVIDPITPAPFVDVPTVIHMAIPKKLIPVLSTP